MTSKLNLGSDWEIDADANSGDLILRNASTGESFTLGGSGDTVGLDYKTAVVPFSQISDGDNASFRANIPSGETLYIWEAGVQDSTQSAPTGLTIEAYDLTNSTSIYSANSKNVDGAPLASKAGNIDVSFRVFNSTGGAVDASGYINYTVE